MTESTRFRDVERINDALVVAQKVVQPFTPGAVEFERKPERGDPVTEADHALDAALRACLPEAGEGWLSEESVDDPERLTCERVWIVDPLDGTREFVAGIPEWCISIALVEKGIPVVGGILNPVTEELVIGAVGFGVTYNGDPVTASEQGLERSAILASRSEVDRGEWQRFSAAPFSVTPCGSVAYKMALVAAGRADATWTLVPKSEWDVAAGVALVRAAGGVVMHADGSAPRFNQERPLLPNLLAGSPRLLDEFRSGWLSPDTSG